MKLFKTSIVGAALALGACSGGTGSAVPVNGNPAMTANADALFAPRTSQATAKVSFLINWPKRKSTKSRHSRFISPSTMSVVLQTGSGKNTVTAIANNQGKPTTQLELDAPVGRDTFSVSLYDAFQKAGQPAVGQELGRGEAVQTVIAGKVNPLHVVIDGVVSKVAVVLTSQPIMTSVSGTPGTQSLTFVGDVPAIVTLEPLDGDGNVIVAPGTVPSVNLQAGLDSTGGIAVTPILGRSGEFLVSLEAPSTNKTFGLVATATDGHGGTAVANIPVIVRQAIYVAYGTGAGSKIAVYDPFGHPMPLPKTAFAGVTEPVGLSYDADDRLIFVADASGKLFAFDGEGNPSSAFPVRTVPGITSVNYFNANGARFGSGIQSPQRVIVGGSSGITEFDATSGEQLAQTPLPFTPTAVSGFIDPSGYSTSGWVVMVGEPAGFIESYDLVTLAAYPNELLSLSAKVPAGFGSFLMPTSWGYSGDYCIDNGSITSSSGQYSSCLYTVTGNTSTIARLRNLQGGQPFGQPSVAGTFNETKQSGTLSAIAVDQLNYYLATTQASQNSVAEFAVTDLYNPHTTPKTNIFRLTKKVSFTTPSSLGLSNPNSIAVQW